jgi:hypothetical protein
MLTMLTPAERDLLAQAAAELQGAISLDDWIIRLKQPGYRWTSTKWYRAARLLEQAAKTPPPPPPPPPVSPLLDRVRSVLILADNPWPALNAPAHYRFWITADKGYRHIYEDGSFIKAARAQHRWIEAWCDCKPAGVGTPPEVARVMAEQYGLDGWSGEGESADAFDRAYDQGARTLVVNLAALRNDQVARIASGEVCVTVELYRNLQPSLVPNWKNANAGIGGHCVAVYGSSTEGASPYPLDRYAANGELQAGVSVYCGGDPKPDVARLP